MSINSRICNALSDFGCIIKPDIYQLEGNNPLPERYFAFNYASFGDNYSDDSPQNEIYYIQIHYYCPVEENTIEIREEIKCKLFEADFTWPDMENASDKDGQHLIFECEGTESILWQD